MRNGHRIDRIERHLSPEGPAALDGQRMDREIEMMVAGLVEEGCRHDAVEVLVEEGNMGPGEIEDFIAHCVEAEECRKREGRLSR